MNLGKILNYIKIQILTVKNPFFIKKFKNQNVKNNYNFFEKNGFLDLGKIFSDEDCLKINQKIDMMIQSHQARFLENQNIWKIEKCDKFVNEIEKAISDDVLSIIQNYFKKKIFISDFDIRRVLPTSYEEVLKFGSSNSDWHKDTRGRQIKMMIYLTPVTATDSYFSLLPGTQKKNTLNFKKSRFKENDILKDNEIRFLGDDKGRALIFDTNITHRLNRNSKSNIRDTMTINFTPGQYLKNIYHGKLDKISSKRLRKLLTNDNLIEKRS
jgi:hypothetical protein